MIRYEKYHGTGNDFLVVDADAPVSDRTAFAMRVCDRERGVGADGVLFLALDEASDPPRVEMTLVQPDGSRAAMCGNGARCVAQWAADRTDETEFVVDTPAGERRTVVDGDTVTVEMGAPTFDPERVPVRSDDPWIEREVEGVTVTAVNTGVPHAVHFCDDVDAVDLETVAPPVRHAGVFPEGANVTLAAEERGGFAQRTFERGVEGETQSCGTGAVAIVAVADRFGRVDGDEWVRVTPPGGDLGVRIDGDESWLRGPAVYEGEGDIEVAEGDA